MSTATLSKLMSALMAGAILLAGCQPGAKEANPTQPKPAVAVKEKAPLIVPANFPDDSQKVAFALKAVEDGYYKEATPLLEQVVAANADFKAYSSLGTARYNLKDYSGAIEAWTKASESDPKLASAMKNNIGNALRDAKKVQEAEAAYRLALELNPTEWNAAVNLADMLRSQHRISDAVVVLEQAQANNPKVDPIASMLENYKAEAKASANS